MANFNTHLNVTIASTALTTWILYSSHIIPGDHAIITACLFGLAGGLFPDLDSDTSKPLFLFFNIFSVIIAIISISFIIQQYTWLELFYIGTGIYIVLRFVVIKLFMYLTVHRGVYHSIPSALLCGLSVTIICNKILNVPEALSWAYGLLISLNYLLHLLLDELISFNLLGLKMKRSFGTALKLISFKNIPQYFVVYGLLTVAIFYAPEYQSFLSSFNTQ
jgi:hypothetical protein